MNPRILLVDDDESSRVVLHEFLADADYDVEQAGTCSAAVAAVEAGSFAVAILDMNLPDGTGPELLTRLRELQPELKVLMLSGETADDVREKCTARGQDIQGCITKPFSLMGILGLLQDTLDGAGM